MPMNYLLILSMKKHCNYYRGQCQVAFPTATDNKIPLTMASNLLAQRLISVFKKDKEGNRPIHNNNSQYQNDPHFKDLVLFYEYFHGDNSRGVGACHQTGWTGVVSELINRVNTQNM